MMDIERYFQKRRRGIGERTDLVKDFRVFDFNYVPEKPLVRDEVKVLVDALLGFEKSGIPHNLIVFGSRGCGKTLMIKYLQKLFSQKSSLGILYVNCRYNNSSFKILAELLGVKARGASLSELFQKFTSAYAERTVVVLDEVDLINPKDRNKEILYLLSRSSNNYMVVLLSNNPRFLGELDSSTRSTLQPEVLLFKNYDAVQIAEILKDRAKKGLTNFSLADVRKIAGLAVREASSDVRVALKTLFYSVTEKQKDVRFCFGRALRDIYRDLVADLNDQNLLILRAVVLSRDKFVKDVHRIYCRLAEGLGEKCFSYVHFLNSLSYLQGLGLVVLLSTKVNRCYTNRVNLLFSEKVLEKVYTMRFG